jgi:hypothetical protein
MSGISTRKIYDECFQSNRIEQETGAGTYKVHIAQIEQPDCIGLNGINTYRGFWNAPNEVKNIEVLSDIESHLRMLDLPDNKCIDGRTLIERNNIAEKLSQKKVNTTTFCSRTLEPSFSRLNNVVSDVKSMAQTRFDYPIIDPKEYVYMGFNMGTGKEQLGSNRFGINSRLEAKNTNPTVYQNKIKNINV